MFVEIEGLEIEVIRKPIKNIYIRIYPPNGQIKISAPLNCSYRAIQNQVKAKIDWIAYHRQTIKKQPILTPPSLQTGTPIPFKGQYYPLLITENTGPEKINLIDNTICYYTPNTASQEKLVHHLDYWYKQELSRLIPNLITHWENKIAVRVNQWGIKKMKTRWGSCNVRARRIWLNLNLIQKPMECIEYVLVHELIHLLEASHNQRFYKLMTQFMPQWQEYDNLLENRKTKSRPPHFA